VAKKDPYLEKLKELADELLREQVRGLVDEKKLEEFRRLSNLFPDFIRKREKGGK